MGQGFADEREHGSVKLLRPLQRTSMAHAIEEDEFCVRNASSEIFRVFALDEFVMLALHDHDRHADLREVMWGVVRLSPAHQADVFDKTLKACRRSR
jgi:hypothetical protein